jgi:CRISPR-associated protein Csd2
MLGRKPLVGYALYRAHGFFSPHLAAQTGVTAADLTIFWQALVHMWDLDRSAACGLIACRGLYVFVHAAALGSAPAHTLFDRIRIDPLAPASMPTGFPDYADRIRIADEDLPDGVTLVPLVTG